MHQTPLLSAQQNPISLTTVPLNEQFFSAKVFCVRLLLDQNLASPLLPIQVTLKIAKEMLQIYKAEQNPDP